MRTIAIINQKGGCGKTTTAINLAGLLARGGKRTLLVDMDPQSHCAAGLGVPEHRLDLDITDALLAPINKPIDPTRLLWRAGRNLDLAPSRMRLAGLESPRGGLSDQPDKERRLARVLSNMASEYDVAIIDCSPAIGLLTYNALFASMAAIIPVETSFFSLQGATKQLNTVKTLSKRMNTGISTWLLPTIHDESSTVAIDLLDELRRRFKTQLAPVVIRRDVKLREAASFGQTIHDYAPGSVGAEDYGALTAWTLDMLARLAGEFTIPEPLPPPELQQIGADPAIIEVLPRHEEEHVSVSASIAAPRETGSSSHTPLPTPSPAPVVSRAEDVARRAQLFLRRVGQQAGRSEPSTIAPSPEAPHPSLRLIESMHLNTVPLSAATQRLLGVRHTPQGVLFVQPMSIGGRVCIAGDFNNWSATSHPMRANPALGVYELCVRLPPGRSRYRIVVDGVWSADPYNDVCELNPFGEPNSVAIVPVDAARHSA